MAVLGNTKAISLTLLDGVIGDLNPKTTNVYSLGTSALKWKNIYVTSTDAGTLTAGNTSIGGNLTVAGTSQFNGVVKFANNTWNTVGDDAQMGDINKAGHIGIQGLNGNTGIFFTQYNQSTKTVGGSISYNGTNFVFDKSIIPSATNTYTLGSSSNHWSQIFGHQLVIQGATNATMTAASANPRITFQEGTGTQPVHLVYTDQDSYRSPAGLKIVGGASATPAWLEVEGNIYGTLKGNADTATAFSTAKSIALTGDVTGSASSTGGWSIATTIANNAVTTAKIKDANVTNAKLANSSITLGATAISLGGTATAITGPFGVITSADATKAFRVQRTSGTGECLNILVDDSYTYFNVVNDETTANVRFELKATDTEGGGGAGAQISYVTFNGANNQSTVTANIFSGSLSGNATSATAFSSNATVTLTGDTTGTSAGSTKSWSVPTITGKLSYQAQLTTLSAIDEFLEANKFKVATFKTAEISSEGFAENDGMIISIPWSSGTNYGAQIAIDDNTNGLIKFRGKSTSWGAWKTILHNGTTYAASSSAVSVTWNTETTIATINGTAVKIKIPANPNTNTDTLVKQTVKSDNVNYKLLATTSASPSSGTAMEATYSANVFANASTGSVSAQRHTWNASGTDKAYTVWNATDESIDFVFV